MGFHVHPSTRQYRRIYCAFPAFVAMSAAVHAGSPQQANPVGGHSIPASVIPHPIIAHSAAATTGASTPHQPALRIGDRNAIGFLRDARRHRQPDSSGGGVLIYSAKPGLDLRKSMPAPRVAASIPASDTQVILDNNLVTAASPLPVDGVYTITPNFGKQVGGNLFFSFNSFSLNSGQTASFVAGAIAPVSPVQSVLVRVTGSAGSAIDGTLQCSIPQANFYLMNPNGITFGSDARLDLAGSFVATTSNYLGLGDGPGRFASTDAQTSVLTSAAPSAFGFLSASPVGINASGSRLNLTPGKTLTLVAGAMDLSAAQISVPAGRVNLLSSASAGEFSFDPVAVSGPVMPHFDATLGRIALTDSSVSVDGQSGGQIVVRTKDLALLRSTLSANTSGMGPGAGIDIFAAGAVSLTGGSTFSASTSGDADAGNVVVVADQLGLYAGSKIESNTSGAGKGGNVQVTANVAHFEGEGPGQGPDADVSSTVRHSGLATSSLIGATGTGGDIQIDTGTLDVIANARVAASTFGAGNAGNVIVNAGQVLLDGTAAAEADITGIYGGVYLPADGGFTNGTAPVPTGRGGDIRMTVTRNEGSVVVLNGAQIDATTAGTGDAGNVTLATHTLTMNGKLSPYVTGIDAGSELSTTQAALMTGLAGNGGSVVVNVGGTAKISNGALISASTFGPGHGGTVNVSAGNILLDGGGVGLFTGIFTVTAGPISGDGGDITIDSRNHLSVANGALITASTLSKLGKGGTTTVQARNVRLSRGSASYSQALRPFFARVFEVDLADLDAAAAQFGLDLNQIALTIDNAGEIGVQSFFDADAGTVFVAANTFQIARGARVSAFSNGTGAAGNVQIDVVSASITSRGAITVSAANALGGQIQLSARDSIAMDHATINAQSSGNGGGVVLKAPRLIDLTNSRIVTNAGKDGGNITIDPDAVVLNDMTITANGGGSGGAVDIQPDVLLKTDSTRITATGATGVSGAIAVTRPNPYLGGILAVKPASVQPPGITLAPACQPSGDGNVSSFVITGQGGRPPAPQGWQPDMELRLERGTGDAN